MEGMEEEAAFIHARDVARATAAAVEVLDGAPRMTPDVIRAAAVADGGYETPALNDSLYLHFRGFPRIEGLEEYTGLKALWLGSNGITVIEGLSHLSELRCLYLQQNLIASISTGLAGLANLVQLDLSQNRLTSLSGLSQLPVLHTVNASKNALADSDSLQDLPQCASLTNADLSHNHLEGGEAVLAVLAATPALVALSLGGNPIVSSTSHFRKAVVAAMPRLRYLDRPIFEQERVGIEAWAIGGAEAEQSARLNFQQRKKDADRRQMEEFREWQVQQRALQHPAAPSSSGEASAAAAAVVLVPETDEEGSIGEVTAVEAAGNTTAAIAAAAVAEREQAREQERERAAAADASEERRLVQEVGVARLAARFWASEASSSSSSSGGGGYGRSGSVEESLRAAGRHELARVDREEEEKAAAASAVLATATAAAHMAQILEDAAAAASGAPATDIDMGKGTATAAAAAPMNALQDEHLPLAPPAAAVGDQILSVVQLPPVPTTLPLQPLQESPPCAAPAHEAAGNDSSSSSSVGRRAMPENGLQMEQQKLREDEEESRRQDRVAESLQIYRASIAAADERRSAASQAPFSSVEAVSSNASAPVSPCAPLPPIKPAAPAAPDSAVTAIDGGNVDDSAAGADKTTPCTDNGSAAALSGNSSATQQQRVAWSTEQDKRLVVLVRETVFDFESVAAALSNGCGGGKGSLLTAQDCRLRWAALDAASAAAVAAAAGPSTVAVSAARPAAAPAFLLGTGGLSFDQLSQRAAAAGSRSLQPPAALPSSSDHIWSSDSDGEGEEGGSSPIVVLSREQLKKRAAATLGSRGAGPNRQTGGSAARE